MGVLGVLLVLVLVDNVEQLAICIRFMDEDTAQDAEDCAIRHELGPAWVTS